MTLNYSLWKKSAPYSRSGAILSRENALCQPPPPLAAELRAARCLAACAAGTGDAGEAGAGIQEAAAPQAHDRPSGRRALGTCHLGGPRLSDRKRSALPR